MIKDDKPNLLLPISMLVFLGVVLSIACERLAPAVYRTPPVSSKSEQIPKHTAINGGGDGCGSMILMRDAK